MSVLQAGGSGEDRFTGISTLSDGSVLLTGSYEAKAGFGNRTLTSAGKSDIFLSRVNSDGGFDWTTPAGGAGEEAAYGLASYGDGSSLVAGYFHGDAMFGPVTQKAIGRADVFIARVDKDGNFLWSRRAGGTEYDSAEAASALADGGAIVAGYFEKEASFGSITLKAIDEYDQDGFITKVDADGQFQWAVSVSGPQLQTVRSVATLTDGSAVIAGTFTGTAKLGEFTLNSDEEWGSDAYIAKLNSDGEFEWAQRIGGSDFIRIEDISSNASNDIVIAGTFSETAVFGEKSISSAGYADAFVAKFNSQGQFDWVTKAGGTGDDYGHGVTNFSGGDVLLTGGFEERANFGETQLSAEIPSSEAYAARINGRTGSFVWATQAEGSGTGQSTRGFDVSSWNDGTAAIAGYFRNNARFGQTSLRESAAGEGDGFMATIDANGAWIESSEPVQPPVVAKPPSSAPKGSDSVITIGEDYSHTFSPDDFDFSDIDGDGLSAILITELPKKGELRLNGKSVSINTLISADQIKRLEFSTAENTHGKNHASIGFRVKDVGSTDNGGEIWDPTANTLSIDIVSINDAPSGKNKTIRESYSHQFSDEDFGFSDTDGDQLKAVKITSLPQAGELTLRGKPVKAGDLINASKLNQLKLTANYCDRQKSASSLSFNFKVKDNGGTKNGGTDLSPTVSTFKLNPVWKGYIQGLSKRTVSKISPDCIKSWSAKDVQKIRAKAVAGLSADQLEAITHLTSLTPEQIKNVNPEAASLFNADDAKKFNKNQFKALSPEHFGKLNSEFISEIDCSKTKKLTPEDIEALGDRIKFLKPRSISCLKNKAIQALTDDQAGALTFQQVYQLANLSWIQFYSGKSMWSGGLKENRVGELLGPLVAEIMDSFKKGEVKPFKPFPATPPNYIVSKFNRVTEGSITSDEFTAYTPNFIQSLSGFDIRRLEPRAFSGLSKNQVEALSAPAIRSLSSRQLGHFPECGVACLSTSQLKLLKKKQLQSLGQKISFVQPEQMNQGMSTKQLTWLTSTQRNQLTFDQIYAIRGLLIKDRGKQLPKLYEEIQYMEQSIEDSGINFKRFKNPDSKSFTVNIKSECSVEAEKYFFFEVIPEKHYDVDFGITFKHPKRSMEISNAMTYKMKGGYVTGIGVESYKYWHRKAMISKYGDDACDPQILKFKKLKFGKWKLKGQIFEGDTIWITPEQMRDWKLTYVPPKDKSVLNDTVNRRVTDAEDFLALNEKEWKVPENGVFRNFYDSYKSQGGTRPRSKKDATKQCSVRDANRGTGCDDFYNVVDYIHSVRKEMPPNHYNTMIDWAFKLNSAGVDLCSANQIPFWPVYVDAPDCNC